MPFPFPRNERAEEIRAQLDHPVIDADGHLIEYMPLVDEMVREIADDAVADRYRAFMRRALAPDDGGFMPARVFWGLPEEQTLDRMTVTLPALTHERAEELGLDFLLLYPSFGLTVLTIPDAEVRQSVARALNTYYAEQYREFGDRLAPVAIIPTFTPEEAVAELDHAVGMLGLRAVVMNGVVPRTVRPDGTRVPWLDTLGHGSAYDYDPLWARCEQLGVAPAFHGIGYGWGSRVSATNYVHNHLGNFAAAQEAVCRSLVMGGVPRRFPELRFAFLEGGVAWGAQLYADLLGHYEKRNRDAVQQFDPHRFDLELSARLLDEFATGRMQALADRYQKTAARLKDAPAHETLGADDFAEAAIESPEQITDIFTRQFSFGCEADDPLNALAFNRALLPLGARLNAMFASDIGHWDVPDMRGVLHEAWELVDDGLLDLDEFRDFTFGNVARTLTAGNPGFFAGTVVEAAVGKLLASA
jgi:predicted TIM-barrel fold metal-dependent hydrolase